MGKIKLIGLKLQLFLLHAAAHEDVALWLHLLWVAVFS